MRLPLSRPLAGVLPAALLLLIAAYAAAADTAPKSEGQGGRPLVQVHHGDDQGTPFLRRQPARQRSRDGGRGDGGQGRVSPPGSVLQLMPNEVMVNKKGFNPTTDDWEFFYIDTDKNGSKIFARGFEKVNNRLGLELFWYQLARPELDTGIRTGSRLRADPGHAGDVRRAAAHRIALQAQGSGQHRGSGSAQAARPDRGGAEGERCEPEEIAFIRPRHRAAAPVSGPARPSSPAAASG